MNRDASDWYLRAATATSDSTMKVGAMMAAAEIAEMTGGGRAEAKKLYMDALTKYSGTVYDNELRKRLQAVLNP
jgi:hypothetical protein